MKSIAFYTSVSNCDTGNASRADFFHQLSLAPVSHVYGDLQISKCLHIRDLI